MIFMIGIISTPDPVLAHALQPGYLQIRLIDTGFYAILWKVPSDKSRPLAITAILPTNCEDREGVEPIWDGTAYVARWTTKCIGGLEGGVIDIGGLDRTRTDVLVRFDFTDGVGQTHRLTPGDTSFMVPTKPGSLEVVQTYLLLGFKHILSGVDHLVFVLALLLLVNGIKRLIITVTAFTVAHSLTLAGATLDLVHLPAPPIEATIALSIMFIASEIINSRQGKPGLTEKYPWVVAFTFGLLHGFGFAGALAQIGLPQSSIPIALLFFNVGVELGQLFFIALMLAIIWLGGIVVRRAHLPRPAWAWLVPPYAIGGVAAFWVFQRLVAAF